MSEAREGNPVRRHGEEEVTKIEAMWASGLTIKEIASKADFTYNECRYLIERNRERFPQRKSKVTEGQKAEMVRMRRAGMSHSQIAKAMGVTRHCVASHVDGNE